MRLFWTGVTAVVLGVGAVGCKNNCQTSADCRAGEVCMRIAPEHDEGVLQCVVQCSQWDWASSECADAGVPGRCICPDSPAGARCSVVDAPPPDSGTYYCDGEQ